MGKTGTTSDFRDAPVRRVHLRAIGYHRGRPDWLDDNRRWGWEETGGRAALPHLREIHAPHFTGTDSSDGSRNFPSEIEDGIDEYLRTAVAAGPTDPDARGAVSRVWHTHNSIGMTGDAYAHRRSANDSGASHDKTSDDSRPRTHDLGAGCNNRVDLEKVPVGTEVEVTRQGRRRGARHADRP